MDTAFLTS